MCLISITDYNYQQCAKATIMFLSVTILHKSYFHRILVFSFSMFTDILNKNKGV